MMTLPPFDSKSQTLLYCNRTSFQTNSLESLKNFILEPTLVNSLATDPSFMLAHRISEFISLILNLGSRNNTLIWWAEDGQLRTARYLPIIAS